MQDTEMLSRLMEPKNENENFVFSGTPASGADYVPGTLDTPSNDANNLLRDFASIKLSSLREVMTDIDELIIKRKDLHNEINNEIDKILINLSNFTNMVDAKHPDMSQKVADLKKKEVELNELKINEKLNEWRDIALLKKELRELVKEFKEKESSVTLIDKILEE